MKKSTLAVSIMLFAVARAASTQTPRDTATCYRLAYASNGRDNPSELFAEYVEVQTAHDRIARSGMGPDKSQDFWRMFLVGGTWERRVDTLIVHFTNGFSGVDYKLEPVGKDSLSGQVAFLYDVVGQSPPPTSVTASRLQCDEAYLQSPAYTQADADRSRREQRLKELRDEEEQRVQALTSPVAGTYEFTISLPGSHAVTVYGRTESHPADPVWDLDDQWNNAPEDTTGPYRAEGYQLPMLVAYSAEALPLTIRDQDKGSVCTASFTVSEQPSSQASGLKEWRGDNDVLMAAARCSPKGPVHDALERAAGAVSDVWFNDVPGQTKGQYVLSSNGQVIVALDVARRGATVLNMRAHRIATAVLSRQ